MEEQQYLDRTLGRISELLVKIQNIIDKQQGQIDYLSKFYSDQYYGMDEEEVAMQSEDIRSEEEKLAWAKLTCDRLLISQQSPYFGRIDFVPCDEQKQKLYIGITSILGDSDVPLVCDWRAPASSMFYDFSKGKAFYDSPIGKIQGEITLKRQYKIKNQKLEYYFDSDINVDDEILQQALSQNKSEKLCNIVSTIQTEQNKVIRNEHQKNLLVQGYAGSGKTTVALHRVAYLLYKYKNLTSDNIVLLSPSEVFSDYISGVLPELGEVAIPQITFENLAKKHLKMACESREEMVERLLESEEQKAQICFKESFDFLDNLLVYLDEFAKANFVAQDIKFDKKVVEKQKIQKLYFENYAQKDIFVRLDWIADYVCDELGFSEKEKARLKNRIFKILLSQLKTCDIFEIYNDFLAFCGFEPIQTNQIRYDDLAGLVYIKGYIFGFDVQKETKHLVVDEMQDYSPLQFAVLNKIYPCAKTIVGDIYQSVYKDFDQDYLQKLCALFGDCELVKLNKTYRSTKQINDFAFELLPSCDVVPFNRDGEEVEIIPFDQSDFKQKMMEQLDVLSKKYNKVAIITKTKKRAKSLYMVLDNENLTYDEDTLAGIPVMPISKCRGLEFDAVITVLDNPTTKQNKSILFVGATRALHKLVVMTSG